MVMIKALLDSFSRCLGTEYQYQEQDEDQPSRTRRSSVTQSLSARAFQSNNEGNDDMLMDDTTDDATNTITSLDQERCCSQLDLPVDFRLESRKNPTTTSTSPVDEASSNNHNAQANVLAHVRQKASAAATARRRHHNHNHNHNHNHKKNSLSPSSSTLSRKASMEKARTRSNKRKLDIFRNVEEPSTFSRLLGSPGSVFPGGAMLCFANPIFEEEEDDMRIRRRKDNYSDEVTIDEETITSTLYFDARYEHVVETRQPMPLYSDYSVLDENGDSDNQIIKLYESGRHKHKPIHSIYCGNGPKLPPDVVNTSMVDSTSSDESDENFEEIIASAGFANSGSVSAYSNHHQQHHQQSRQDVSSRNNNNHNNNNNNNVTYEMANTSSSSCMKMPSASLQLCEPRNDLDVIEDILEGNISHHELDMSIPGLKLMTQSSNSMTTATLTPVCSSRSNTSLSPKLNLKRDGFHFQNMNMNMNSLSDVET